MGRWLDALKQRKNTLPDVAIFPRTAAGRAMMREAYKLSFMQRQEDKVKISSLDWDVMASKLQPALSKGSR